MSVIANGFAVYEDCCSQAECDSIIEQLTAIERAGTRRVLAHYWCRLLAAKLHRRVAAIEPKLESLVAVQCTYFHKSAQSNWFVAFHQDRSIPVAPSRVAEMKSGWSFKEGMTFFHGPNEVLEQMLAVRLHLDDSNPNNGPLRVIPKSHCSGVLSSQAIASMVVSNTETKVTVGRGGVVLMRPLLLHASAKSRTDQARCVLHFVYGPKTLPDGLRWPATTD